MQLRFLLFTFTLLFIVCNADAASSSGNSLEIADYANAELFPITPLDQIAHKKPISKEYQADLFTINTKLQNKPNDTALLYKKASIYADVEQYTLATEALKKITAIQPHNSKANALLAKIAAIKAAEPHNEIGFLQDEAYASDLNSFWTYSTMHYYRFTEYGKFGARVNYAARFGTSALQYQLEAYPLIFKGAYADLAYAFSNRNQTLFPNNQLRAELYFTPVKGVEASIGERFLRFQSARIYTYTGSLGKYFGSYFAWVRPYFYNPTAQFYEVGLRHYFDDKNKFIAIKFGAGKYPDIGTITPLTQLIIVTSRGLNIDGQYPLTKTLFLRGGVGYAYQTFAGTNTMRNLTDVSLGLAWQF